MEISDILEDKEKVEGKDEDKEFLESLFKNCGINIKIVDMPNIKFIDKL